MLTDRFWNKVDKDTQTGCWDWVAGLCDGYGRFHVAYVDRKKVMAYAHRLAWEDRNGPIPDGLQIDHLCRNRRCVNPSHLEVVTHEVNVLRGGGPSAVHARQTHCVHGHELNEENTYRHGRRRRSCRPCNLRRVKKYQARKKAEA